MAQYSNLKAYIEEKIYENGTQAITGDILQDVLKVMTDDLGEFYQTGGVASPATDPGTPDAKVIYIATEAGTYTNFGNIELAAGEVALLIFDTSWVKETLNVLSSANGGVKTANLADGAVTTAKIANGAVGEGKIADASVTSGKLGSGAVTTEKIADGAATTDKIANKAVATGKLGDKAVTSGKIADSAVGTTQVANEAITEGKIADEAVTAGKIADGAVTNGKINDGAVTEGKIGSGAVTTGKIGAKAVTTGKIADKAVTTGQLGDKAVTSDKIADGAVGSDQLAEGAFSAQNLADGSVTTDKLADDAVTAEKIADGAVTAGKFADGSVTTAKIGSSAITTEKIGDGMVTRRKIADAAVTTAKLDDEAVTTAKVADANVTTAKIADANVTTGKLADGAVTTAKIADGNVTGVKLQEGVRPVINVNALNEQSTAYGSAALARAAVPSALRILGLHVIYLLAGGWFEDEFFGSDVSGWGTASNWRAVGPVSVSQNTLTIGGNYAGQMSDTYDVTLHNSGATFASLSALLSDANLATLIPADVRQGGMTIKFVQTSDNKYVQFLLKAQSFTTDITKWEDYNSVNTSTQSESDLDIVDERKYVLARFQNGEIATKNFDSSKVPVENEIEGSSQVDLSISDENNNKIVEFLNGHIRTKYFDSSKIDAGNILSSLTGIYNRSNPYGVNPNVIYKDAAKRMLPSNVIPLIVIAGQSNADGRAPYNTAENWDSTRWLAQNNYSVENYFTWNATSKSFSAYNVRTNNGTGPSNWSDDMGVDKFGFDPFFAKQYINTYGTPLYAVKMALGGIGIEDYVYRNGHNQTWNPRIGYIEKEYGVTNVNYLLLTLLKKIQDIIEWCQKNNKTLLPVAILWHQGERDASEGFLLQFKNNLSQVISFMRGIFQAPALPFINGFLNNNYMEAFAEENQMYLELNQIDGYMKTVDMTGHYTDIGDGLHYDGQALAYMGEKMFDYYYQLNTLI